MRRIASILLVVAIISPAAHADSATTSAHLWSRSFGGSSTGNIDCPFGVAVDAFRNVIIAGNFDNTANFGGSDLVSAGGGDMFIAKYSPTGVHLWSKRFGDSLPQVGLGVAVDASGNIFVAGTFSGTTDFGSGVGIVSNGGTDMFVTKYAPGGAWIWTRRAGGASNDQGLAIALDAAGNPIVTGYFNGTVDFGNGVGVVASGNNDVFVAKYDGSNSAYIWSKTFGNTQQDAGTGLATDAASNVYATGYFNSSINPGTLLTSAGQDDIFLVKYNSAGTFQWGQRFGSTLGDEGNAVGVDGSGNVVVTGYFSGSVSFGGSTLVSAGFSDIFLAKYNTSGLHQWSERFGGVNADMGFGLGVSPTGDIAVTGSYNNSLNLGGATFTSNGASDVFLARYNAAGVHQWSRSFGGISNDDGRCAAIDAAGNVVTGGRYQVGADFGGGGVWSNGFYDGYVAKYAANGAAPAITSIADIGNDQGRQVKIKFNGSGGDNADGATPITSYEAYRRSDAPPSLIARGDADAPKHAANPEGLSQRQLLDSGWTFAGSVPAHQKPSYSIDAPTIGDSTLALGQYYSVLFIRAASQGNTFYDSAPDSGYSKDNLAPAVPQNLVYGGGNLTWHNPVDADFKFFTVYGSNTNSFGAATLVNYTISTAMDVTASPYVYYFVTATDFSGNEGKPAKVNTLSGVGGTPLSYVLSVSNYPNPFNPRTMVNYTVPSRGHVNVRVFDAHGALVMTLFDGERNMGAYTVNWDGRAGNGELAASGLYFARIEHNGVTRTKKMVLLK